MTSADSAPAPRGAVVIDMGIYRARRILEASTTLHRGALASLTSRERRSLHAALDNLDLDGLCACWTLPGRRCLAAEAQPCLT